MTQQPVAYRSVPGKYNNEVIPEVLEDTPYNQLERSALLFWSEVLFPKATFQENIADGLKVIGGTGVTFAGLAWLVHSPFWLVAPFIVLVLYGTLFYWSSEILDKLRLGWVWQGILIALGILGVVILFI